MKIGICGLLALMMLLGLTVSQGDEPTKLTYFVDYEEEQEEDFIEAQLLIESQSQLLTAALNEAKQAASEVAKIASDYCKQNAKKSKGDCKEAVDVSEFQLRSATMRSNPSTNRSAKKMYSLVQHQIFSFCRLL